MVFVVDLLHNKLVMGGKAQLEPITLMKTLLQQLLQCSAVQQLMMIVFDMSKCPLGKGSNCTVLDAVLLSLY